jgi:hypothetical protein
MMSVIEFKDRKGSPLYHLEHFIEGDYIKYNSNSGFVEEHLRYTPQVQLLYAIHTTGFLNMTGLRIFLSFRDFMDFFKKEKVLSLIIASAIEKSSSWEGVSHCFWNKFQIPF